MLNMESYDKSESYNLLEDTDVVNSLTSSQTNVPLSANQGRLLNSSLTNFRKTVTKIYAGTIVRSMSENGIGIIFNDTEINEILGVNDSDSSNTAVFIANGDRSSYYNNLYAVGHQKYNDAPIAWHAYASSNTSGQCRIQYLIVYWGGTE